MSRVSDPKLTDIQFEIIDIGVAQARGAEYLPRCFKLSRIDLRELKHREQTLLAG